MSDEERHRSVDHELGEMAGRMASFEGWLKDISDGQRDIQKSLAEDRLFLAARRGKLDLFIESSETKVGALEESVAHIKNDVDEIFKIVEQGRGGWKMFLLLTGAAATAASALSFMAAYFPWRLK